MSPAPFVINEERLDLLPPKARDKALQALRDLEAVRKARPLEFYNNPNFGPIHKKQMAFHGFHSKVNALLGGNQSAKTTSGIVDDIIQGVDEEAVPEHLKQFKRYRAPFRCWIAANSRDVTETVIFQKMQEWIPKSQLAGESWKAAYDKQLHILTLKNGTQYFFKTYEQEVDKWGGASVDRVHMDEEPPKEHLNEAWIRTMARGGDLLFTMTPTNGLTHMFDWLGEFVERATKTKEDIYSDDELSLVLVDMDDNPYLSTKEKERALAGLSAQEKIARKEGRFIALHGLIYPDFREEDHVIPPLEQAGDGSYPALHNTNVIVGIDPGIRHACGVLWTYLTHDDHLVAFEEGYYQGQTIKQVCEAIHKVNTHYNVTPIYYVIDPAARNRSSQTGRSDQMEFVDHGILTIPGQNDVRPGIVRVMERLQDGTFHMTENCTELKSEIRRYRWRKPPRTEDAAKETPVKKDDHLVDPLRYIVMSRPYKPDEEKPDNETPAQRKMREHIESVTPQRKISVA